MCICKFVMGTSDHQFDKEIVKFIFIYRIKHLNLIDLARACISQMKDDIAKIIENVKEDYFSVNFNEYDNFKVIQKFYLNFF